MPTYKHRELTTTHFLGQRIDFVASNDRLKERVTNLSHESHVLEKLVEVTNADDVFWDIGACLGIHSFVLAKHLPDGTVVGFEPMQVNRGVLMDNKSVNDIDNVIIERRAISDTVGTAEFAIRESMHAGYGRHSFDTGDYEKLDTQTIETVTGDALAEDSDIPLPNVVKIDVEGAEPLVLEGMEDVLSNESCRHVILETHEPNPVQPSYEDYGYSRDDLLSLLESYGFTVDTLSEDFHLYATKTDSQTPTVSESELDVELVQGDIANQDTDGIVNSAGTSLRMGTGVAGALRDAAGEALNTEAIHNGPVTPGEAVVTDAYDLDADYVIHAASMPHYGTGESTPETIRSSVRNALQEADSLGLSTLALPAVGCGLGGVPLATGVQVIAEELRAFTPTSLASVTFVAYTSEEYDTIARVLGVPS